MNMSQRNKYLLLLVPLCILATFLLVWFVPRRANSSVPDRNDLPPLSGNATVANNQTSNPHEPATPNTFTGIAFSGITTDPELASLVNQAFEALEPSPRHFGLAAIYDAEHDALHEGTQWLTAYWTFNSYGFATATFPFANEALTNWISHSQDFWFRNRGDGIKAPRGIFGDGCTPTACGYQQGDGQVARHDWIFEGSMAGAIMKTNQLLAERNQTAIDEYAEMLLDAAIFAQDRRDTATNLLLGGPSSNLVAPSYIGWVVGNQWLWGHPSGITLTSIALDVRLSYLLPLTTAYQNSNHPKHNFTRDSVLALNTWADTSRKALPQLLSLDTANTYFVKSLDGDGKRHGDMSQPAHRYIDSTVNLDALLYHREVFSQATPIPSPISGYPDWSSASLQTAIMDTLLNVTDLRLNGFMRVNAPSLDDTEETCCGIWEYGRWVNGGLWLTNEGRLLLSYARLNRMEAWKASLQAYLQLAQNFNTDPQSVMLGGQVGVAADLDSFSIPAAAIRAFFDYRYDNVGLTITPQLPLRTMLELNQHWPVKLGAYRIYLQTLGPCCSIANVTIATSNVTFDNNLTQPWLRWNNDSVTITFAAIPPAMPKVLNLRIRFAASDNSTLSTSPFTKMPDPVQQMCNLTRLWPYPETLASECQFPEHDTRARDWHCFLWHVCRNTTEEEAIWSAEAAQARMILQQLGAMRQRCQGLIDGSIPLLNNTAADAYLPAVFADLPIKLETGLVRNLQTYASETLNTKAFLYRAYVLCS